MRTNYRAVHLEKHNFAVTSFSCHIDLQGSPETENFLCDCDCEIEPSMVNPISPMFFATTHLIVIETDSVESQSTMRCSAELTESSSPLQFVRIILSFTFLSASNDNNTFHRTPDEKRREKKRKEDFDPDSVQV
jgi:hypothetical protein